MPKAIIYLLKGDYKLVARSPTLAAYIAIRV